MKTIVTVSALLFGLMTIAACNQDGAPSSMSANDRSIHESFTEPPAAPWQWIRENPEAWRIVENGGMEIMVEPGGLMGEGKDAKNILVQPWPTGATTASVVVTANHQAQYEQAGLILYRGDDDYVKLVVEMVDGTPSIVLVTEVDARPVVAGKIPCPGLDAGICKCTLVLNWNDGLVEAMAYSVDAHDSGAGMGMMPVGNGEFPTEAESRIGVFSQGGEPGANRWVKFEDFRVYVK